MKAMNGLWTGYALSGECHKVGKDYTKETYLGCLRFFSPVPEVKSG